MPDNCRCGTVSAEVCWECHKSTRDERDQAIHERDEARAASESHQGEITTLRERLSHEEDEHDRWRKAAETHRRERDDAIASEVRLAGALAQALSVNTSLKIELTEAQGNVQHWHGEWEYVIDEKNTLLAEGLAIWDNEPRPGLRSAWFDFWQKVRKEKL